MIKKILCLVIFFLMMVTISFAESPPPLPNTFGGTVRFVDLSAQYDAPVGTQIDALIDNEIKGNTVVGTAGIYKIDVIGTESDDNKSIIFRVDGRNAGQKAFFNASYPHPSILNLIVNISYSIKIDTGGGSKGGTGGGGGGTSGESFSNIELREKYDEMIYKDKITSYRFKNASNPVMYINITGNVNAGLITAMVEVLKGRSSLVKEVPPGTVYKNVNLWVGSSGFSTSKNIKEATVMFRVENSWIDSNALERSDIKLLKYHNEKWITLETSEIFRESIHTYFNAWTDSFSCFAIVAIKAVPSAAIVTANVPEPIGAEVTTTEIGSAPAINLWLIAIVIILISIVVTIYILGRK